MNQHSIVHVEIASTDPNKAAAFYKELFGWEMQAFPDMDYVTFQAFENSAGGFPRIDGEMYKKGDVIVYVGTDDIEGTLKRIEALGGKTVLGKTEIPGTGWFALFTDPSGTRVGLFDRG